MFFPCLLLSTDDSVGVKLSKKIIGVVHTYRACKGNLSVVYFRFSQTPFSLQLSFNIIKDKKTVSRCKINNKVALKNK